MLHVPHPLCLLARGACSDLLGMPREHEPSTGTTKGDRSGQPQAAAMISYTMQARSLWDYLCIFLALPQGGRELSSSAFKPTRAGECRCKGHSCKSCGEQPGLQPSLPIHGESSSREIRPRAEQRRHSTAKVCSSLLLDALAGLESGQTALQGFGIHCWLCLAAAGGEGCCREAKPLSLPVFS